MTARELTIDHLSGSLGVTQKIKDAMKDAARQFVYIGFLLWEVKKYEHHYELNYGSVYEYAEAELGFKRSTTKNFIAICEQFCKKCDWDKNLPTMHLDERFNDYSYSQLTEMLAMSAKQREQAKPDMTIKQLRQLKKDETVYCTINEDTGKLQRVVQHHPEPGTNGQTSGQPTAAAQNTKMHDASWWVPDANDRSKKLVQRTDYKQKPWDIGYYNSEHEQWYDQEGMEIEVSHWMELPGENNGQTSGQELEYKSIVLNNIWKLLPPKIIKGIVKAAGLRWNPKFCYNINVEKHIG